VHLDIERRSPRSVTLFQADMHGLRIHDETTLLELRWSAVRAVIVERRVFRPRRVRLLLEDGSVVTPAALQGLAAPLAGEVQDLWRLYGPLGASAMWTRTGWAPSVASAA
jgi:hypothetical protein